MAKNACKVCGKSMKTDISVTGEGSIFLLDWLTKAGKNWIAENIPSDAQRFGDSIVVEHRYIKDIIYGMVADGLVVR
jgi:hypothetical protein